MEAVLIRVAKVRSLTDKQTRTSEFLTELASVVDCVFYLLRVSLV